MEVSISYALSSTDRYASGTSIGAVLGTDIGHVRRINHAKSGIGCYAVSGTGTDREIKGRKKPVWYKVYGALPFRN
eukprot:1600804-Rhodomonas_salina.3